MKKNRKLVLLSWLLISITIPFTISCDKDDPTDPADTVTLNMLNEENGKTLLGKSDVYINKANNFRTSSSLIADAGIASGLGVKIKPLLENLTQEVAVNQKHVYQIFDLSTISDFPSGNRAIKIGAGYYQLYVDTPIKNNNLTTGAVVKYFLAYPEKSNLPELDHKIGDLYYKGQTIEMEIPKNAECVINNSESKISISNNDGKLSVTLNETPNENFGPFGFYYIFIRLGHTYTTVMVNVTN